MDQGEMANYNVCLKLFPLIHRGFVLILVPNAEFLVGCRESLLVIDDVVGGEKRSSSLALMDGSPSAGN